MTLHRHARITRMQLAQWKLWMALMALVSSDAATAQDLSTVAVVAEGDGTTITTATAGGVAVDQRSLAQQVNNPIANLISVPVENNWDSGIGTAHATKYLANIEPVIPFSLNEDWNLITRTVVPVIDRQALVNMLIAVSK